MNISHLCEDAHAEPRIFLKLGELAVDSNFLRPDHHLLQVDDSLRWPEQTSQSYLTVYKSY